MSTIYQAIANKDVQIHLNELERKIFFSGIPKNGVDQCDGTDDPTGERSFRKALGDDLAEGISFNDTPFSFGQMRKCTLHNSQMQVIASPRAPDVFQENLTNYLSKICQNVFIASSYTAINSSFGSHLTALTKEGVIQSIKFEIEVLPAIENNIQITITKKNGVNIEENIETLCLDLNDAKAKATIVKNYQKKIAVDFISSLAWLKKRANPVDQVEGAFWHCHKSF